MKIISFLGFNNYIETNYIHPTTSQAVRTKFFQEALVEFYQPDTLYVLLTPTVATKIPRNGTISNWQGLQEQLANKSVKLEPVFDIPESNSLDDSWLIFDKITNCLNEGDRVIFDLTHSFRSIPVIALLAISYLRTVKQVQIEGVLYGAFDPNAQGADTPTYDLLPMLSLLDWLAAADRFVKVGDGSPLAELLKNTISNDEKRDDPTLRPPFKEFKDTADIINRISLAIALVRPVEILEETTKLEEIIKKAESSFDKRAKPFGLISQKLTQEYGQFALENPTNSENLAQGLRLQFQLIDWYIKRHQVVQAMTLAREWLVSVLAYRLGEEDPLNKDQREQVENALHNGQIKVRGKEITLISPWDDEFEKLPDFNLFSVEWGKLVKIRNDIAHVGMNKSPQKAESLEKTAAKIILELKTIADTLS
ncbi:TIGR02221 family CRISPR-associated protein [Cylindrospermopsis raciborskii]|uniref:TIGR02221 family CRISPR-associated protein n=1 Tax=Cylindrospermopsis raciborskii TaxID=77022 RepID=UPI000C9E5621|nr:TIGR02221 family CRISPR-associated protein [Cylindrospermopsis raciborskii]PNK19159.1 CRISPR-associated protein [Cylindrospermopsis raciborskii S01]